MKYLLLILTIFVFVGCGGVNNLSLSIDKNIIPGMKDVKIPELNVISKAEVGSNMYEKGKLYQSNIPEVVLLEPIPRMRNMVTGAFGIDKPINLGRLYTDKETNSYNVACTNKGYYHSHTICLYDTNNDFLFDKAEAGGAFTDLEKHIAYKIDTSPKYRNDSFKYVALYQGKKGNTIKVSFREFKDNMARPAFTQNIEYELDDTGKTIIGFKGLRIEVLKATNFDITYKVIKDYN